MKLIAFASVVAVGLLVSPPLHAQDPLNHPLLFIDSPHDGGMVGQTFGIKGTALNSPFVHVWAYPVTGPVWIGEATTDRPDVERKLAGGAFSLHVTNAPIGTYPIVVYAFEPATGTFPTQVLLPMQVHACQMFTVSWQFMGAYGPATVPLPFCA